MYKLIRSRYDGLVEIVEEVARGTYEQMKNWSFQTFNYGAYVDDNGHTWYTEILKIEEDKEMKTEKIEIRVDSNTKREIKEKADRLGLSVSAYLVMLSKKDGNESAKE